MNTPLLSVQDLEYTYSGNSTPTLRGASLDLFPGEVVAVTGHSGSGKSTLLHIMSGMFFQSKGSISWEGVPVPITSEKVQQEFLFERVGMVFQAFHVIPYLTVVENMLMGSMFFHKDTSRLEHLLEKTGMAPFRDKLAGSLSGGQKQRVAIGRAMMKGAKILLADEPTGNLDEATGQEILNLFHSLARDEGCGVCFVTHELTGISSAEKIYAMHDGKLQKSE